MFDATEWIRKDVTKRLAGAAGGGKGGKGGKDGGAPPPAAEAPAVFCCGDFNEEGASAVSLLFLFSSAGLTSNLKKPSKPPACTVEVQSLPQARP